MAASDTSSWIGNLDPNLPRGAEKLTNGDDAIRHFKTVMRDTWPNMSGVNNIDHTKLNLIGDHTSESTDLTFVVDTTTINDPTLTVGVNNIDLHGKIVNNVSDGVTDGKGVANQDTNDIRYYQKSEVNGLLDQVVADRNTEYTAVRNQAYPVGTIYYTVSTADPQDSLKVGQWTKLGAGRFVVGQGSGSGRTYNLGNDSAGRYTQVITLSQLPAHKHITGYFSRGGYTSPSGQSNAQQAVGRVWELDTQFGKIGSYRNMPVYAVSSSGGGGGSLVENSPPAYCVYAWRRFA